MLLDSSHSAVCLPEVPAVCIMYMDGWQWCLENVSHARWWRWLHIRAGTILSRLNLRDQNILNTFVPKQASFYEGVFSTWPTYHKHCTQPSDTEICCDCEYERPWVDRAQGTGCSQERSQERAESCEAMTRFYHCYLSTAAVVVTVVRDP